MKFYEVLPDVIEKNAIAYREGHTPLLFVEKALINVTYPGRIEALTIGEKGGINDNVYTPTNEDIFANDWVLSTTKED